MTKTGQSERSDIARSARNRGAVVTIGTYDGVHLGHRRILAEVLRSASDQDLVPIVVTFDRHPAAVVRPALAPPLLTALDHKLELLRSTGVVDIVVLHFDSTRAHESAEEFVTSVLVNQLHVALVMVGANFRFGHDQRGDVALLEKLGGELGFNVAGVDLVTDSEHHDVVSSSRIRALVRSGSLVDAAELLGRAHEVRGVVAELSGKEGRAGVVVDTGLCMPPAGEYSARVGLVGHELSPTVVRVIEESSAPFGHEIELATHDARIASSDRRGLETGARFAVQFT